MPRLRTILEWSVILVLIVVIGFFGYLFIFGGPAPQPSGLPDSTGGFYQSPVLPPQKFSKTIGGWQFALTSSYTYTVAGRIVGRHAYPSTPPEGIIPLDLAVVNGELIRKDLLSFFTFRMGERTLTYSYDIPAAIGLPEEYIDQHISNNHLVFLDPSLEQEVKTAPEGSCIIISGRLIDIAGTDRSGKVFLNTSTVRNDEYPSGCEIILVETFRQVSCGD